MICKEDQVKKIDSIKDRADYLKLVVSTEPAPGAVSYAEIETDFSDKFDPVDVDKDHPAVIIFSAGLLGKALGATLTHDNLDSNAVLLRDVCGRGQETHALALIPLFHAFGASVNLLGTIKAGGTVYLVEKVDFPKLIPWLAEGQNNVYRPRADGLLRSPLSPLLQGPGPLHPGDRHKWRSRALHGNL